MAPMPAKTSEPSLRTITCRFPLFIPSTMTQEEETRETIRLPLAPSAIKVGVTMQNRNEHIS
ncbi:hypothetical protein A1O1_01296 [Capronia coronata CBS 617.96]|uniref:Uncharacterized protein n=1 Tax=Capronia coronata CBS 617.96 TaxID=1182541 RepID=W9Z2I2_9EURO|nr:uncharacterized protein A1O1_01296 [Capronia coronata CBS 617.96]EXJ96170.1 hypothetical protein A1O1_01296 [Capronia coronata CBS 617.96]